MTAQVSRRVRHAGTTQRGPGRGIDLAEMPSPRRHVANAAYYFYAGYGIAATSRDGLICDLLRFGGIIVAIEFVVTLFLANTRPPWAFWPVIADRSRELALLATWMSIAGVIGTVVSVQRRLEDPRVDADPYFRYIQTGVDRLSVSFSSPFFGAVFGYLMCGLIRSKLILGSVIVISPTTEISAATWAFMLILGFISGFAEQLTPDVLSRVAAQALGSVSNGSSPFSLAANATVSAEGHSSSSAGKISLTVSNTSCQVKSKITVTVDAPGITGAIAATTSTSAIFTIGPILGSAPGPPTFDVTAREVGSDQITVTAGSASAMITLQAT